MEDRFRHCLVTSCSTNSTAAGVPRTTASFVMRTTVTFTFAANARVSGDGEHHAIHHTEAQLKVNEAKSAVARPQERKFLGSALGWSGHQASESDQHLGCFAEAEIAAPAAYTWPYSSTVV